MLRRARMAKSVQLLGDGLDHLGFESLQEQEIFRLFKISRPPLESTHPPIKSILGAVSLGIKWSGHEVDHLTQTSTVDKNKWGYTCTTPVAFIACLRTSLLPLCFSHVATFIRDWHRQVPGVVLMNLTGLQQKFCLWWLCK